MLKDVRFDGESAQLRATSEVRRLILENVTVSVSKVMQVDAECMGCIIEGRRLLFQGHGGASVLEWSSFSGASDVRFQNLTVSGFGTTRHRSGSLSVDQFALDCKVWGFWLAYGFADLALSNGTIQDCGAGAISGARGELRLHNMRILRSGRAVDGHAKNLSVDGSTFSGNEVAIRQDVFGRGANTIIRNSVFDGNTRAIETAGDGAVILLQVESSTFRNSSEAALLGQPSPSLKTRLDIRDSVFENNGIGCTFCDEVGAIRGDYNGTIRGSSFQGNFVAIRTYTPSSSDVVVGAATGYDIDAAQNWWGSPAGARPQCGLDGPLPMLGDTVCGSVLTEPHLTSPP